MRVRVNLKFYDGQSGVCRAYTPPDAPRCSVWGEYRNQAAGDFDPTRTLEELAEKIREAYNLPNVPIKLGFERKQGDKRPLSDGFRSGDIIVVFLNPIF